MQFDVIIFLPIFIGYVYYSVNRFIEIEKRLSRLETKIDLIVDYYSNSVVCDSETAGDN